MGVNGSPARPPSTPPPGLSCSFSTGRFGAPAFFSTGFFGGSGFLLHRLFRRFRISCFGGPAFFCTRLFRGFRISYFGDSGFLLHPVVSGYGIFVSGVRISSAPGGFGGTEFLFRVSGFLLHPAVSGVRNFCFGGTDFFCTRRFRGLRISCFGGSGFFCTGRFGGPDFLFRGYGLLLHPAVSGAPDFLFRDTDFFCTGRFGAPTEPVSKPRGGRGPTAGAPRLRRLRVRANGDSNRDAPPALLQGGNPSEKAGPESGFAMKKVSFLLAEIHDFTSEEAQQLLHNKFVIVIGDSNYRAIYKDLVYFLQTDEFLSLQQLREKHEPCFANDRLVELNESSGNDYRLVRQYRTRHHLVRFYFVTRAYSSYVDSILRDLRAALQADLVPDVVIVHSCLWDLNRYHDESPTEPPVPKALREYRQNVEKLFQALDEVLPGSTLVIWNTAMAITQDARCYVLEQPCKVSAEDMMAANFYSASLAEGFWFDSLDLHYHFRFLQNLHAADGTHWNFRAHRYLTKLLLTHLADAWQVELEKQRLQMDIPKFRKVKSRPPSSPWGSVDPAPPQLIPTLCTNGSGRQSSSAKRPPHLRRHAHKKRLRGSPGQCYQLPIQLGGPHDGLHHEGDPWLSAPLPDPGNSPIGSHSRPISSSEGPQPIPGYHPRGPECGGYAGWPVGSSEEEQCLQPGPNFNSHAPGRVGWDSWPMPPFEGEQGPPHYYDAGRAHEDPFHVGGDAMPVSGQEYRPPGYSWVPDASGGHRRPISFLEQGGQFYPGPLQDGEPSSFADQGLRFHPNSPSYFPQGIDNASRPLSIVAQETPGYFQAAHGPDYGNQAVGFPGEPPCPPFHPWRDLPVHRDVRSGPWSTDGDEGDWGFPFYTEENYPGPPFWVPYHQPRRRPHRGACLGSRKMLPRRPRRAAHRRQGCAPYAASQKRSRNPH